jgi:hypothetical protein
LGKEPPKSDSLTKVILVPMTLVGSNGSVRGWY